MQGEAFFFVRPAFAKTQKSGRSRFFEALAISPGAGVFDPFLHNKAELAQGQDLGDLVEHSALASILHQLVNDSLIRDGLEVEASAGDSVGLVSGHDGVHSQTFAGGFQVGLGLVLSQAQLDVLTGL